MVAVFLIATLLAADPPAPPPPPSTHTRPLSDIARAVVDAAATSSPTIASMIAAVDTSDVIVYIDAAISDPAAGGGWTRFVGASKVARFVQVTVNLALDPDRRAEVLAHELQHVLEIARAKDVRDSAGMERLFIDIGWRRGHLEYDTAAAIDIEGVVHRELWKMRSKGVATSSSSSRSPER